MPVTAVVEHGTLQTYDQADESGILVKKTSFKPKRDFVEKKGSNRAVAYVRCENPMMDINISGTMVPSSGAPTGLATSHPSAAVTLANFSSANTDVVHGFAAADGKLLLLKDATRDTSDEEEPQVDINVTLYPFITPA